MKAELQGIPELERELNKRFGKAHMTKISDYALIRGARVYVRAINREVRSRPNKGYAQGYTVKETDISNPMTIQGVRTIKIHWKGMHGRYRIIHLNEFGTVKNPNPPRKGALAVALRSAEAEYKSSIKDELRRGIT